MTDLMAVSPLQATSLVFVAIEGGETLLQYDQLRGKTQAFERERGENENVMEGRER